MLVFRQIKKHERQIIIHWHMNTIFKQNAAHIYNKGQVKALLMISVNQSTYLIKSLYTNPINIQDIK